MPVLLRTEEDVARWLDCEPTGNKKVDDARNKWTSDLANLCKPFGQTDADLAW